MFEEKWSLHADNWILGYVKRVGAQYVRVRGAQSTNRRNGGFGEETLHARDDNGQKGTKKSKTTPERRTTQDSNETS